LVQDPNAEHAFLPAILIPYPYLRPDVPHALLERPASRTYPFHRDGDTPLPSLRRICERTTNRLTQLLRSPESLPAFSTVRLKNAEYPAAYAAVLGCPDAFLLHAPTGSTRLELVCSLAEEARALGQRLLVLAQGSDAANLAQRFHERGCTTILCSTLEGLPTEVLPLTERRQAERERAEECLRLEAQVNRAAEQLETLEKAQRQFQDFKLHQETLMNELAELQQPPNGSIGLGGFVKKLFGSGKTPAELTKRIATLEEQLSNLDIPPFIEPAAIEQAAAAHRAADATFAWAIAKPLELAAETVASAEIVVANYDAFDTSPLLADDCQKFDRLVVVDGEDLEEAEFMIAADRAEAWVLFGNPEADGYFTYLWMQLHKPGPWAVESARHIFRLDSAEPDRTEPLIDRPEIELRFAGDTLAAIVFPPSMLLLEAKEFVARELGQECIECAVAEETITYRTAQL